MPDIRIHRDHALGLKRARQVAWAWAEKVEQKYGLECTVMEGDDSDTVAFTRSGVHGELTVAATHFDLHAKLGLMVGAFATRIREEIEKELDALLVGAPARQPRARK